MSETAQPTAAAAEEEDEDVLTFSTDDSEAGDAEPDTATTEPPAEEAAEPQAGSPLNEKGPAESEATAPTDKSENKLTAPQKPTSAPANEDEAIRRRQARFGLDPTKPVATGVRQAGVAKRSANAFASAMNQQPQSPGRGRGFLANRGRGVGSFRGRGRRGPAMQAQPLGSANLMFGPPEAPVRAPRPPAYPPPALGSGLAQPELMGNAFAGIKDRKPAKPAGNTPAPGMAGHGAQLQNAFNASATFNATAPTFRPRMPSGISQGGGRGHGIVGSGQMGMPPASQVAKASTWVRSEAAPQPVPQASTVAHHARPLESKPVATASTWINPKLKQNGGQPTKPGGAAVQNAPRAKQASAAAPSDAAVDDKDAEIMALKARLQALERGKRTAEDDGEHHRGYNTAGSSRGNGKRFKQTQSADMAGEPTSAAGNGRSKMGILERVQFGAQRSGNGNPPSGGTVNDARGVAEPQQRSHHGGDMRHRQKPRTGSPGGREQRRQAPDPSTSKPDFSDVQKRRMDRFAARG